MQAVPLLTAMVMLAFAAPASAVEYLAGGDFEGGTTKVEEGTIVSEGIDHPSWTEVDNRFASPICSKAICGTGSNRGPRGGENWTLFGAYEGTEGHQQIVSQWVTLPAVEGAMLSFHARVGALGRRSVIHISFDTLRIQSLEAADLPAVGAGYQELSVPIAEGGLIEAGQHLVRLRYLSDPETEPKPANFINVDDASFTATPLPVVGPPAPGGPGGPAPGDGPAPGGGGGTPDPAPDTAIKKVLRDPAKQRRSGGLVPAKAKFFFEGLGGEAPLTFECKLDKGVFKPCNSPTFFRRLKLGRHLFEVRAVDGAGRRDPTPAVFAFKSSKLSRPVKAR